MPIGRREVWVVGSVAALLWLAPGDAGSQETSATIRLALLSHWTAVQHGADADGDAARGRLLDAVERGVVDRTVFAWQRGRIDRSSLVAKPVRVLPGSEAAELGGRGSFRLGEIRPPRGGAAWTEVAVIAQSGQADDVALLEIGGELGTTRQVLAGVWLTTDGIIVTRVPLSPVALFPGPGIPVWRAPFGRPVVASRAPAFFSGTGGLAWLVVRSQIETVADGTVTTNGQADLAMHPAPGLGDWREGDRVLVRLPLAALRDGAPAVLLSWKDRALGSDPEQLEFPRD